MDNHPIAVALHADALARLTRPRFCGLIVAALGAALGLSPVTGAAARCRKKSARCDRGFCYPRR